MLVLDHTGAAENPAGAFMRVVEVLEVFTVL